MENTLTKLKHPDFTISDKKFVLNVRNYFKEEKKRLIKYFSHTNHDKFPVDYTNINKRTATALRISAKSVQRIHQEKINTGVVTKSQKHLTGRKKVDLDSFTEGVIRRKVLQCYANKQQPNLDMILKMLQEDENIPKMCRATLRNVMTERLKFKFIKFHDKPVALERTDITAQRHEYLQLIRYYRQQGYKIMYQDETWLNENESTTRGWHIPGSGVLSQDTSKSNLDIWLRGVGHRFKDDLLGGITKPSGRGRRVIVSHVGSEDGFLLNCEDIFIGNTKSNDYHDEMCCAHFEEWFKEKFLLYAPEKSVIVLDRAKYHRRVTDETKNPKTHWNKADIINWLNKNGKKVPKPFTKYEDMTIPLMLSLAKKNPLEETFVVDKLIEQSGKNVKVLWLPIAHCELNAIELIWADFKRNVRILNTTFKVNDVKNLAEKVISNIQSTLWTNCIRHVQDLEEKLRTDEGIVDDMVHEVRQLCIRVNDDSDDSDIEDIPEHTSILRSSLQLEAGSTNLVNISQGSDSEMEIDIFCNCKSQAHCCKSMKCICRQYKVPCGINCHKKIDTCHNRK